MIDNLESLLQPDKQWRSEFYRDFFSAWLEYGSQSTVLITTRERPEFKGCEWIDLKGLKPPEGAALLKELQIRGNLEDFSELVDGHPLLLRLVADLLKDEYPQDPSLERLADLGLGDLRQLLSDPRVVGQHNRKNVGMVLVLDASFERLGEEQKTLFLNLSVYREAFDAVAAAAMLEAEQGINLEQELRKLVKRSLLAEKFNGKRLFEFQPVVLEYARYKAGDQTETHQRAINYYCSQAKAEPWQTIDDVKEYLEIFYHCYQLGEYDLAFDAIRVCDDFLTLRGYYTIRVDLYGQLVAAWQQTSPRDSWKYTAYLTSLGNACFSLGQYQRAIEYHQQSLTIKQEISDRSGEANSYNNLGNAYNSLGQYQRAIEYHQQSLSIKQEIGGRYGESYSYNNLGNAYDSLGQYQRAIEYHQQSLSIKQEIGDRSGEASSYNNLGNAYNSLGQYQRAIEYHQQSLAIVQEIGDHSGEANSYGNLGNAYNSLGQYQQAIEYHQQCLAIVQEIGDRYGEAGSYNNLGNAYYSLGQYQQAIKLYQQSLAIKQEIGDIRGEALSWFNLGLTLENLNREADAMGAYRNARQLYQAMGLDAKVQDCDNKIASLSSPISPPQPQTWWERLKQWLRRLWRWFTGLWQ